MSQPGKTGSNLCCLSQKPEFYNLSQPYDRSPTFHLTYCQKPLTINILGNVANDCFWEYDKDGKGGKTILFLKPLSDISLKKLIYILECGIKNFKEHGKGKIVFKEWSSCVLYSRYNGISCTKWFNGSATEPQVYNINSNMESVDLQDPSRTLLDSNHGALMKGDLVRIQVQPQVNIQTVQETGEKIYHLQFMLKGSIFRGNPHTSRAPNPVLFDEEDPLSFLSK